MYLLSLAPVAGMTGYPKECLTSPNSYYDAAGG